MKSIYILKDSEKRKEVSQLMKTISHSSRLAIIDLLLEKGPLTVTEIHQEIDISQSSASQHLKALVNVGVLAYEREAQRMHYQVANPLIAGLLNSVNECTSC